MSHRRRQHIARRRLVKRARRALVVYSQLVGAALAESLAKRRAIGAIIAAGWWRP